MKFNRDSGKPSMKKLYQNFVKKRWTECEEEGERKNFLYIPIDLSGSQYPVYRPCSLAQKQKTSAIYQIDYLKLLMAAFKAYQLLYQVEAVVHVLHDVDVTEENDKKSMTIEEYEKQLKKLDKTKLNKVDFVGMEKDIEKLTRIVERLAPMDNVYIGDNNLTMDDIVIDTPTVLRYRDDIKHYLALRELIGKYYKEYGDIFTTWNSVFK